MRGPGVSHLRQVSTGSSSADTIDSEVTAIHPQASRPGSPGPDQDDSHLRPFERLCSLLVHDDTFSREDVLVNLSLLPDGTLGIGDLAEIAALRSQVAVRDFQDHYHSARHARRVGRPRRDPRRTSGSQDGVDERFHLDMGKSCCFVVKDLTSAQRSKQPKLEV